MLFCLLRCWQWEEWALSSECWPPGRPCDLVLVWSNYTATVTESQSWKGHVSHFVNGHDSLIFCISEPSIVLKPLLALFFLLFFSSHLWDFRHSEVGRCWHLTSCLFTSRAHKTHTFQAHSDTSPFYTGFWSGDILTLGLFTISVFFPFFSKSG